MVRAVHRSWFTPRFLPTLERYFLACRIESWTFGVYIYIYMYWTICSRGLQWKLIAVVARGQCAFRRRNFVIRRENGGIVFIASPCIFRRKDRDIRRLFYPTSGTSMWIIRRGSKLSLLLFFSLRRIPRFDQWDLFRDATKRLGSINRAIFAES